MYNTAKYLPKCMDSLLHQDLSQDEYEIILVDDCSSDNSVELANEYAQRCKNIKVCTHNHNKGLAGGRNTGVDAAEGEYLAFVDPDDYVTENSFGALLKQMEEEDLDMLRCNYQKVNEEYELMDDSPEEAAFNYTPGIMTGTEFVANRLGIACFVWAYIYRMSCVKQANIRFIEGIFFDDTPWLPRVLQKAKRVNCNPIRHHFYLQRSGSMVHSNNFESIKRKVDGQMALINVLKEHKHQSVFQAQGWYDRFFAHASVNLLTSMSVCGYKYAVDYYIQLKQLDVFPLSEYKASGNILRKIKLINTFPYLLLLLLSLKNKK